MSNSLISKRYSLRPKEGSQPNQQAKCHQTDKISFGFRHDFAKLESRGKLVNREAGKSDFSWELRDWEQ
ncbi:CLUMA_CG001764, isoform A [Clunio marinus]|uniref:CLUMA_CG001764, isoform A n=1 Tax=Clunio marinus TaxID=568069 RepID=A0A1J1HKA9_9DIPT|nr:CLUMA_CG001764, isoform A [Clunio marinus]